MRSNSRGAFGSSSATGERDRFGSYHYLYCYCCYYCLIHSYGLHSPQHDSSARGGRPTEEAYLFGVRGLTHTRPAVSGDVKKFICFISATEMPPADRWIAAALRVALIGPTREGSAAPEQRNSFISGSFVSPAGERP